MEKMYSAGCLPRKGPKTAAKQMADYTGLNSLKVGAHQDTGAMAAYHGDISEIILFTLALNRTQVVIVDNYLAVKYGLPRMSYYTSFSHTYDVQGIGSYDGTSTNRHSVSRASRGLGLYELNQSLLGGSKFLFAGHSVMENEIVTEDLSEHIISRWRRTWWVEKTGQIDAALSFDFVQAHLPTPGTLTAEIERYKLLFRASATEPFVALDIEPVVRHSNEVVFDLTNNLLLTGYYTLGYGEPGELLWTGQINGDWNNAANWSKNHVPQNDERVRIDACTTCPRLLNDVTIASLTMTNASSLDLSTYTLTISGNTSIISSQLFSEDATLCAANFVQMKDSRFLGAITLIKSGGTANNCDGGNLFDPSVKFVNDGNAEWRLSTQNDNEVSDWQLIGLLYSEQQTVA